MSPSSSLLDQKIQRGALFTWKTQLTWISSALWDATSTSFLASLPLLCLSSIAFLCVFVLSLFFLLPRPPLRMNSLLVIFWAVFGLYYSNGTIWENGRKSNALFSLSLSYFFSLSHRFFFSLGTGGLAELGLMVTIVVVPLVNLRLALETK